MKTKIIPFVGAATALITPMNSDYSIDFDSFGLMIEKQIDAGIDALLILGTTGESSTLSDKEKQKCIDFASEQINGRIPLIVGTGSNDTESAVKLSRYASDKGADAVLVVTPYYNKTTDTGLIRHYTKIADSCSAPVILYNIPQRTGMTISYPVYKALAEHDNIVAVKEASGSISAVSEIISGLGSSMYVYSGNDSETVPVMACGGIGVFSVLSNIMPREVVEICSLMRDGRGTEASALSNKLCSLVRALFCEVNPIPVKAACEMIGLCSSAIRPPLCELSDKNRKKLRSELRKHGLI